MINTGTSHELNTKNSFIFLIALAVMILIYLLPTPDPFTNGTESISLTPKGKAVIAVLVFALILWTTEAIPFSITGLTLIVILHLMNVADFKTLVQVGLGNSVIFFLMGAMGISISLTASGLSKRLMLMALTQIGVRTDRIILLFLAFGTLISMWVTDMAVAAMLLPLGTTILRTSNCKPLESNFGRGLMIAIVWGALIGGTATPAGCGPNVLAMEFVRKLGKMDVTFGQWMAVGVPGALAMIPIAWYILLKMFPPEMHEIPTKMETITADLASLGPLCRKEINALIVFFFTVFLWLGAPVVEPILKIKLSEDYVALLAFVLLFMPGLRVFDSWKEAATEIDWGGLILIAGGISAGTMLADTGAARWVAWGMLSGIADFHPIIRVAAVVTMVEFLKIFFSSNSVTGAVVIPLIIVLALDLGMNPWVLAGPAGIASSMAFIMVTSSPTNVIPYSSGYFSIMDYAKAGVLMTIAAILCVTLSVALFGRFAHMNIW